MSEAERRSILLIEKSFLKPPPDPLRGGELFTMALARDLARTMRPLLVPAHVAWRSEFSFRGFGGCAVFSRTPLRGLWSTPVWLRAIGDRRFATLILGNVANGLIPLLTWLHLRRTAERLVLIAHRTPSGRFLRSLRRWQVRIVAVNSEIARQFCDHGFRDVSIDYGVADWQRFRPASFREGQPVRFIVLGALDQPWKGAAEAVQAFCRLSPRARERAELHLAGYLQPPSFEIPGLFVHRWMRENEIPDFLREMDVIVCPSRDEGVMRETFSQAMVQGMLSGLPVLARDLPVYREKLEQGGGFLFADVNQLSALMELMIFNPDSRRREGNRARAIALERYCWDTDRFLASHIDVSGGS
ncbi:MAG: glycosyltransferase family 4 protein [Kiritimatiellae bacterium]|nr:glycosyltransferase family 4 protein [Kiritimatiellia bacterium]MDW8459194.1 glycosyltransferase family 4 protein [Verrucomicrobiota bacterium]